MSTKRVDVSLDQNDVKYILQALIEFKENKRNSLNRLDEENDLVSMYGNDIMIASETHAKLKKLANAVFNDNELVISYELL